MSKEILPMLCPNCGPPRSAEEIARELEALAQAAGAEADRPQTALEDSMYQSGLQFAYDDSAQRVRPLAGQQPVETVEQQEARHRAAIRRAREESHDASLYAEPEQPRDLAGRIRALVQEYAGRYADADNLAEVDALQEALESLQWAAHSVRVGTPLTKWIEGLRERAHESTHSDVLLRVADDLERIVRECEARR